MKTEPDTTLKATYKRMVMHEGWKYWQVAEDLWRRVDCGLISIADARTMYCELIDEDGGL